MRLYELLFITNPEYDDEKVQSVIARYQEVITKGNGVLKSAEKWGKRRFAYEINDMREGLYILMLFEAAPSVPTEIDRLMKIDQDVIRHVIVRKDETAKAVKRKPRPQRTRSEEPRGEARESHPSVRVVKDEPEPAPIEPAVKE